MTPRQFLQDLAKSAPASAYLFLGDELYSRDQCRQALVEAACGSRAEAAREDGRLVSFDLSEQPLGELLDEARTLSLFAGSRLIVGSSAEGALPRRGGAPAAPPELAAYLRNPTPGVVLLLESVRYNWDDRDDKSKIERVGKYFDAISRKVEFRRLKEHDVHSAASTLARRLKVQIAPDTLAELVEMLGADMARLAKEMEKLSLYIGGDKLVTAAELETLIPEARQRGMYEFSDALAGRDGGRALEIVANLARSGNYWPMQLNVLAGLFRQALAASEQKARTVPQVMRLLQGSGLRVWPARAKQIAEIARSFSQEELETAVTAIFEADRDLRRERPDDRLIVEQLVLRLTGTHSVSGTPQRRARG
jgi:DNA polymerase-3 subunit delta